jgi:hypothetical protein
MASFNLDIREGKGTFTYTLEIVSCGYLEESCRKCIEDYDACTSCIAEDWRHILSKVCHYHL